MAEETTPSSNHHTCWQQKDKLDPYRLFAALFVQPPSLCHPPAHSLRSLVYVPVPITLCQKHYHTLTPPHLAVALFEQCLDGHIVQHCNNLGWAQLPRKHGTILPVGVKERGGGVRSETLSVVSGKGEVSMQRRQEHVHAIHTHTEAPPPAKTEVCSTGSTQSLLNATPPTLSSTHGHIPVRCHSLVTLHKEGPHPLALHLPVFTQQRVPAPTTLRRGRHLLLLRCAVTAAAAAACAGVWQHSPYASWALK